MSCPECKHRLVHVRISADDVGIVDSLVLGSFPIIEFNSFIFDL